MPIDFGKPTHITTAQPGTLFARITEAGTMACYPVASWAYFDGKQVPLFITPSDMGPRLPTEDDMLAFVGICPADKEPVLWFASETLHEARRRYFQALEPEMAGQDAGWSVEAPGYGKIPVKYSGPPGQRPDPREPVEGMGPAHVRRANVHPAAPREAGRLPGA